MFETIDPVMLGSSGVFLAGAAWAIKLIVPVLKNGNGKAERPAAQVQFETEASLRLREIAENTQGLPAVFADLRDYMRESRAVFRKLEEL